MSTIIWKLKQSPEEAETLKICAADKRASGGGEKILNIVRIMFQFYEVSFFLVTFLTGSQSQVVLHRSAGDNILNIFISKR